MRSSRSCSTNPFPQHRRRCSQVRDVLIRITRNPIRPEAAIESVRKKANGGVIAYVGTVRDVSHDRRVIFMEHQAEMQDLARQELERIAEEIRNRWHLEDIAMIHRIGKLRTGEILLTVAIGAPHRVEAFEACQYAVDRFKEVCPQWTTETLDAAQASDSDQLRRSVT